MAYYDEIEEHRASLHVSSAAAYAAIISIKKGRAKGELDKTKEKRKSIYTRIIRVWNSTITQHTCCTRLIENKKKIVCVNN